MTQLRIGILGSGVMGKQIAILFAAFGNEVVVWNHTVRPDFDEQLKRLVVFEIRKKTIPKEAEQDILGRVRYVDDIKELRECDVVIEAVKENREIKLEVLRKISSVLNGKAILASNTSSLKINELARAISHPNRFLGIHFLNPPTSTKLVEVVKSNDTTDETLATVFALLNQLGKHAVVIPDLPGFVVNRVLMPMINGAISLVSEGTVDSATIDRCLRFGANHPMGPLELADFIGLDVCLNILETLFQETGNPQYKPSPLLVTHVQAGKLGRKSGEGFYSYRKKVIS